MTHFLAELREPRCSQRGSVLSGVLIIVAFLSIIAAAIGTQLSTNFLLSRSLLNRVANQATLDSAVDFSLSQLQATPLDSACPPLGQLNLNGRTAVSTYISCWPTVDARTQPFQQIAGTAAPFNVAGVHAQLSGLDDYVIGNAGGRLFDFSVGSTVPRWSLELGGTITAPPLVVPNSGQGQFLDVIPLSGPSCSYSAYCLSIRTDDGGTNSPPQSCSIVTFGGAVVAQPAASPTFPGVVYYGSGQRLEAANTVSCNLQASVTTGNRPVVAGPISFSCLQNCSTSADEVYTIVADSQSSRLVSYSFRSGFAAGPSLRLPWPNATGLATSSAQLPASVAITFASGGIALIQIGADGGITLTAQRSVPAAIMDPPHWCHCPTKDLVGVGAQDGGLYVFDSTLTPSAAYPPGGPPIRTTPGTDGGGNWYFGADDGFVYEVQNQAGQILMALAKRYGPGGQVGSTVQVLPCSIGICLYVGDLAGNAYMIPLDARDVALTACISSSPPQCSAENPRVWSRVVVGVMRNPRTLHVTGWSYYSL